MYTTEPVNYQSRQKLLLIPFYEKKIKKACRFDPYNFLWLISRVVINWTFNLRKSGSEEKFNHSLRKLFCCVNQKVLLIFV